MSSTAAVSPKGRDARKPTDIPSPGWKDILLRVYHEFTNDRVLLVAAGATFYLLLALVPALTALVSIYGLFAEPAGVQEHMAFIQDFMPGGGQEILADQLGRLSAQPNSGLGFALVISLALALWSSNAGMKALFEAMNVAYDEAEKRGFVKLTLTSLGFTLGAIVLLLAIIGIVVIMPLIVDSLGLGSLAELVVKIGSAVVLVIAGLIALSALYRWGPSRAEAKWKWITPGATVAVVVGMIASLLFSWYVANFGSYNETYGSLGAIIGFMTWLWIMVAFVITGGELNAEMEHQTRKDSTTGPEQPLGTRGAQMADTVASGPDDTGDRNAAGVGAQSSATEDRDAVHDRHDQRDRQNERIRDRKRVHGGTPEQPREPIGVFGALMLLGAVALMMAASGDSRDSTVTRERPKRGPDPSSA